MVVEDNGVELLRNKLVEIEISYPDVNYILLMGDFNARIVIKLTALTIV